MMEGQNWFHALVESKQMRYTSGGMRSSCCRRINGVSIEAMQVTYASTASSDSGTSSGVDNVADAYVMDVLGVATCTSATVIGPFVLNMLDIMIALSGGPGQRFEEQKMPKKSMVNVDSDHANECVPRKSTSCLAMRFGMHTLKQISNLGMQAYFRDIGMDLEIEVTIDSISAKSFASMERLVRQQCVQTRLLWIRDIVARGTISIKEVNCGLNVADAMTKAMAKSLP